ncbi:MAG: 2-phosphosulfolactate phosphatase [Melioribacteraceae bacterium]|nr:2-phosphosulfolactate phosphatase [Melioribacteraceae bacterium]
MKTHVLLSPQNVDELYFTGKTTVFIDVLRATTVIVNALNSGAREIIPVGSVDFAMKISGNARGGQTLLCGERNTKMVEGFDLGNSPLEYHEDVVRGKSIILFTTNGSKAALKAKFSENLIACCFNNLASVARRLVNLGKDVEILCAGSNGMFCIEDTVCAGLLINEIEKLNPDIVLTDASKISVVLNKEFGQNIKEMLYNCEHGKLLIENGFEKDIDHCAELSNIDLVPVFENGVIKSGLIETAENN